MEEMTFKSVARYFLAASFLVLIFAWIPSPFSLLLTYLMVFVAVAGSLCGVIAIHRRNAMLRLIYLLNGPSLFYLIMLRMWDRLAGLSWVFILASLAGVMCIALLPYVNKRLSGIFYREQQAPRTKIGQWILRVSLFLLPFAGVIGAVAGLQGGKELMDSKPFLLSFALVWYVLTLGIVFHVMFRHANDLWMWHTHGK